MMRKTSEVMSRQIAPPQPAPSQPDGTRTGILASLDTNPPPDVGVAPAASADAPTTMAGIVASINAAEKSPQQFCAREPLRPVSHAWTRDQDHSILMAAQRSGAKLETWTSLIDKGGGCAGATSDQVAERFAMALRTRKDAEMLETAGVQQTEVADDGLDLERLIFKQHGLFQLAPCGPGTGATRHCDPRENFHMHSHSRIRFASSEKTYRLAKPHVVARPSQPSRALQYVSPRYGRSDGQPWRSPRRAPGARPVPHRARQNTADTGAQLDVSGGFSLPGALPRTFDFEGVAGDVIAKCLVRLLDDDRVRSLEKERAVELIGDENDRLCEYACGRNFEVLKWAHNELDLRWAPYPAGRVSDDILVLRVLRESWATLKGRWPEGEGHVEWRG